MEIRNYSDFEQYVVCNIQGVLGEDYKDAVVEIGDVSKTNVVKRALTIKKADSVIAPTIYLEQFYDEFKDGTDIDLILAQIAALRKNHEVKSGFDISYVMDFENVRDRIVPKVINEGMNSRILKERPYKSLCDLAVVYYILVDDFNENKDGQASIGITMELFKKWDITLDELHSVAVSNMRKLMPATFRGLGSVLTDLIGQDADLLGVNSFDDMIFVATNNRAVNGAMVLTDDKFLGNIHSKLGDMYIIPCSVHEVLVLGADGHMNPNDMVEMIKQVNSTELEQCDILSNNLYSYNPVTGLQIVGEDVSRISA